MVIQKDVELMSQLLEDIKQSIYKKALLSGKSGGY